MSADPAKYAFNPRVKERPVPLVWDANDLTTEELQDLNFHFSKLARYWSDIYPGPMMNMH